MYHSQKMLRRKQILLFLSLLISCSDTNRSDIVEWENTVLPNLRRVVELTEGDTTYLVFHDDSWIWSPEYVDYRTKFVIWKNKDRIDRTIPIKVMIFHLDGEGDTLSTIFSTGLIDSVFAVFDSNPNFQKVSEYFLTEFTPTEVLTLRNANFAINNHKNDSLRYTEVLFKISKNTEDSLAYNRAKLIIEMVNTVGMKDFFDKHKMSGESFVKKVNAILRLSEKKMVEIEN